MGQCLTLVPHDPDWENSYEALRHRLSALLGRHAVDIQHVGSTSIRGVAAKPILDVDVLIDRRAWPDVLELLRGAGYEHRGDLAIAGREAFAAPSTATAHHLYVCISGTPEWDRHLRFRDYLRSHPAVAADYVRLKRRLAVAHRGDRAAYTEAKGEFIEQVLAAAEAELRGRVDV